MSGLAVICKERGMEVSGSDVSETFITDKVLEEKGIPVYSGFRPENLSHNPDLVIVGASWGRDNVEVQEAMKRNIPIMMESDFRGALSREKKTIVVAGVHGKSTTTALLTYIFTLAGRKPSYLIGTALIPDLGVNGHWDDGEVFIVEGDEYAKSRDDRQAKFLDLEAHTSIITSIEWEHADIYKDGRDLQRVFSLLIARTKDRCIICRDWKYAHDCIEEFPQKTVSYGMDIHADWRIQSYDQRLNRGVFYVFKDKRFYDEFELRLIGRFNALNALACLIAAEHFGISRDIVRQAFQNFSGLERRMDIEYHQGVIFVDDYAHHPTEIRETLKAIRGRFKNRRIICIFQPHTASRTKAFLNDFAVSFSDADDVILMDIYSSAREKDESVHIEDLFLQMKKYHPRVQYCGDHLSTVHTVRSLMRPENVIVTLGAGDVYRVRGMLLQQ